jgi:hypothetical protein
LLRLKARYFLPVLLLLRSHGHRRFHWYRCALSELERRHLFLDVENVLVLPLGGLREIFFVTFFLFGVLLGLAGQVALDDFLFKLLVGLSLLVDFVQLGYRLGEEVI